MSARGGLAIDARRTRMVAIPSIGGQKPNASNPRGFGGDFRGRHAALDLRQSGRAFAAGRLCWRARRPRLARRSRRSGRRRHSRRRRVRRDGRSFATMRDLCEQSNPAAALARRRRATRIGAVDDILAANPAPDSPRRPAKTLVPGAARFAGDQSGGRHLRRVDAGARHRGAHARRSPNSAAAIRAESHHARSAAICRSALKPGSPEAAMRLKAAC
jgi:hypothetical protein